MSISSMRQSPAIVVAVVALVAAVAGTAVAGPGASTSAVTKAKVKKIANKQINKRIPWKTGDIADNAVTAGGSGCARERAGHDLDRCNTGRRASAEPGRCDQRA